MRFYADNYPMFCSSPDCIGEVGDSPEGGLVCNKCGTGFADAEDWYQKAMKAVAARPQENPTSRVYIRWLAD